MSSLTAIGNILWSRRKYWKGPIIVMLVVVGILFTIEIVVRIVPTISAML